MTIASKARVSVRHWSEGGAAADRNRIAVALSAPAVLLLCALFIVPVITVMAISVTDWNLGERHLSFVGFQNYARLFADPYFGLSVLNTVAYVLTVVPAVVAGGLLIALLVESNQRLRAFYRAVHFLPYMAAMAAMAIVWEALLHPTIGLLNQTLLFLGLPTANWLRDPHTVLPVLAAIGIWRGLGFAMVLFLAGLKRIPRDLYDAVAIDGASDPIDRLVVVTIPLLGPVTLFVAVVTALQAFSAFDTIKILTQGGPNHASDVLLYTLYATSFEFLKTSYGATVMAAP